ncbi:MAG: GreA/GreB family elongation factor, partial [Candidatus Omnitrophica bacterium]|nr:GreA/GreB family elongation factor [Candidatus Omnitrophota bacterium]
LATGEQLKYMMVSPEESNYEENKLSILSPVGKGLIGRSAGEEVQIKVPAGVLKYKIIKIERPK